MVQGTYYVREHEVRLLDVLNDIIGHGFGEVTIQVSETKNFKTKVLIVAGRSWAYFITKKVPELDRKEIL